MSYEDQDYHRRRAEIEMDKALKAQAEESALAHLELARMHRAKRLSIVAQRRPQPTAKIFGTDKEA